MESQGQTPQYSVPREAKKVLLDGIINNDLHADAPDGIKEAAEQIKFVGGDVPEIPINWRFAESISAIKGFQGAMVNVLLKRKYGVEYQKILINTDHAQLFIMSPFLPTIDPEGAQVRPSDREAYEKYFPNCDRHNAFSTPTPHIIACTNIYRTKEGRYFHLHGSFNPEPCQDALGLPHHVESVSIPEAYEAYQAKVSQMDAATVESVMNDEYRQAGTICWSTEEYLASPQGRANAHVGLFTVHHIKNNKQRPTWWNTTGDEPGASRPLFGLKVVDLTRVIASPTITRELAELGASVMRIASPNVTDAHTLALDLGWGKWNAHLDLKRAEDRERLRALILESDVVVDGYRPGVMAKWGFGKDDILALFAKKTRGVVYVHENCYGWNGPLAHRSGWQQISDAHCGVSLEFGRAMGLDEPVTPVLPNSDFCTGASGATGVLQALIQRAEMGGSYVVDVALNYYSQWLIKSCSVYPREVWERVWAKHGRPVLRHSDNMPVAVPKLAGLLKDNSPALFGEDHFEDRPNKTLGVKVRTVKPVLRFPSGLVRLGYNVGSRGNGVDQPKWPENLLSETVY